jgi:hypothetical protein
MAKRMLYSSKHCIDCIFMWIVSSSVDCRRYDRGRSTQVELGRNFFSDDRLARIARLPPSALSPARVEGSIGDHVGFAAIALQPKVFDRSDELIVCDGVVAFRCRQTTSNGNCPLCFMVSASLGVQLRRMKARASRYHSNTSRRSCYPSREPEGDHGRVGHAVRLAWRSIGRSSCALPEVPHA